MRPLSLFVVGYAFVVCVACSGGDRTSPSAATAVPGTGATADGPAGASTPVVRPVPVPGGAQPAPVPGGAQPLPAPGSSPRPRPSPTAGPGPSPSPSPTPEPPSLEVGDLVVSTGRAWRVAEDLDIGSRAFVDRTFVVTDLDQSTRGATLIRTDTRDAFAVVDPLARFEVNRASRVCVAWDVDWPAPDWLADWFVPNTRFAIANETATTTDDLRLLFCNDFPAGVVELGPARARPDTGGRAPEMYVVVVTPR